MNNEYKVSGVVIAGIITALVLIPAFSDDTIFLINGDNGTPEPCAGNTGLVLAQNLTDLCDVTIILPTLNQTLVYNGSQWVNTNQIIFNDTTTCNNIGTGTGYVCVEGTNVNLRSLLAGSGITISNSSNTITISASGSESTVCSGQSGNYNIVAGSSGGNCTFKNLVAGSSISISSNSTHIIITNSKPEQGCTSAGGTSLLKTPTTCDFKGLTAGVGLTLTSNTNDNNYKTNFVNGTGISITGTGAQTFTNTGVTSLTSADTNTISLNGSTGAITITPTLQKLCDQVATGSETTMSCTLSNSAQSFYIVIWMQGSTTNDVWQLRFNTDSGTNYATRSSTNGAADGTTGSATSIATVTVTANQNVFYQWRCENPSSGVEKYCYGVRLSSANGAANPSSRVEFASKWANTASNVSTVDLVRTTGTGTLNSGSYIMVWGLN